jgi:tagatose-1,6-bisphosphate aldolase
VKVKTNKDFNLSKSSKRILATLSTDQRGSWKKMMIDAEMAEKRAKLAKLTMKSDKGEA